MFSQPKQEEPAQKRQRTVDQVPSTTQVPRVNPDDTTRMGQASITTVQEALGFSNMPAAAHELAVILQFETSYELVSGLLEDYKKCQKEWHKSTRIK